MCFFFFHFLKSIKNLGWYHCNLSITRSIDHFMQTVPTFLFPLVHCSFLLPQRKPPLLHHQLAVRHQFDNEHIWLQMTRYACASHNAWWVLLWSETRLPRQPLSCVSLGWKFSSSCQRRWELAASEGAKVKWSSVCVSVWLRQGRKASVHFEH